MTITPVKLESSHDIFAHTPSLRLPAPVLASSRSQFPGSFSVSVEPQILSSDHHRSSINLKLAAVDGLAAPQSTLLRSSASTGKLLLHSCSSVPTPLENISSRSAISLPETKVGTTRRRPALDDSPSSPESSASSTSRSDTDSLYTRSLPNSLEQDFNEGAMLHSKIQGMTMGEAVGKAHTVVI